ncbi:MAG: GspE/PulE family protein, partial [Thermoanaerobaculia bacterium]
LDAFRKPALGATDDVIETRPANAQGGRLELDRLTREALGTSVVRMVSGMLTEAIRRGASDVHLEPYESEFRVRFRIDGVLYEVASPSARLREAITSRLKVMANLDIAEKRLPQDGRIRLRRRLDGQTKDLDVRVSVMPTIHGEKTVIRLLDRDRVQLDMTRLGFEPGSLRRFDEAISQPYGMVLVTGPTGSGKTSTLYSALTRLNRSGVNIMTAEDPVELHLQGVNQVHVKEQIGLSFAAALRSFLRQDPDVILVGEIRDAETAEMAIKAAMTGHLVLSTLHTNDAASAIARLQHLGVEPFLVAGCVHLVAAQRLVRRICTACREPFECVPAALVQVGFSEEEAAALCLFRGRGCERCSQTGYRGRIALFEVMPIDAALRQRILAGAGTAELRQTAVAGGMITMRRSGLQKLRDGITTVEEVLRETVI